MTVIMRKVSHSSRSSESPNRGDKRRSISRSCLEKSSARSRKKRKRSYSPSSSSSSSSCSSSSSSSCCHSSDSEDDYKKQKMKKKQKLKKGKKKEKIKMKKIHKQEKKLRHLSKKLKKFKRNDATEIVVTRNEVPKCDATNNDTIRCDVIRNNVATTSASISKQWKDDDDDDVFGPSAHLLEASKARAPMTKEEWERQQSYVRRVFDPETGRHRLVKGTGEILEECVSRERHLAINRATTREDGEHFQSTIMAKIKKR